MANEIYTFDRDTILKLKRDHELLARLVMQRLSGSNNHTKSFHGPETRFVNSSGATIPPYACMAVVDNDTHVGNPKVVVEKPSSTFQTYYQLNKHLSIADDGEGYCQPVGDVYIASLDTAGTPGINEVWGPKPDSWLLWKGYPGYRMLGTYRDDEDTLLGLVVPEMPLCRLLGRTTDAIVADSSTTDYIILAGDRPSVTDSGFDVPTAYSVKGIDDDSDVLLLRLSTGWEIIPLDCNA